MSEESLQAAIDLRMHDTTDVFELITLAMSIASPG